MTHGDVEKYPFWLLIPFPLLPRCICLRHNPVGWSVENLSGVCASQNPSYLSKVKPIHCLWTKFLSLMMSYLPRGSQAPVPSRGSHRGSSKARLLYLYFVWWPTPAVQSPTSVPCLSLLFFWNIIPRQYSPVQLRLILQSHLPQLYSWLQQIHALSHRTQGIILKLSVVSVSPPQLWALGGQDLWYFSFLSLLSMLLASWHKKTLDTLTHSVLKFKVKRSLIKTLKLLCSKRSICKRKW